MGALLYPALQQVGYSQRFSLGLITSSGSLGLLLAFELIADHETMAPLPRELNAFERLVDIAYDNGLIIYSRRTRGGHEGDHFLVCPPMIVTADDIEEILSGLKTSLDQFAVETGLPFSENR